jgi:molecular chaperone GrpE (heat shock protein)
LTPEQRTEQGFSLYGRALDDGYIAKTAAQQAQQTALDNAKAEWEKGVKAPDPKESDAYKQLQGEFDSYKQMQQARTSEDYKGVKGKFFETVYGMVDRKDGAKPVAEQLADIRKGYEEYFEPEQRQQNKPTFGAPVEGSMPKGETGAVKGFTDAWGFVPKKN